MARSDRVRCRSIAPSQKGLAHIITQGYGKGADALRLARVANIDHLHVLLEGRIAFSGGPEVVKKLEDKGYDWVREKYGQEVLAT